MKQFDGTKVLNKEGLICIWITDISTINTDLQIKRNLSRISTIQLFHLKCNF